MTDNNSGNNLSKAQFVPHVRRLASGGTLAIIAGVGILYLIYALAHPLAVLILCIALAAALSPIVDWMSRWMRRSLAVPLLYTLVLLPFVALAWLIVPELAGEVQDATQQAPEWIRQAEGWIIRQDLPFTLSEIEDAVVAELNRISTALWTFPLQMASAGLEVVLALVISIYILIEMPGQRSFFLSLFPPDSSEGVHDLMREIFQTMGGFVRGSAITALIIGTATYTGLRIIGVPYPLALALFAGFMEIFPVVGPVVSTIPILFMALTESQTMFLIAAGFMLALQQLEGNLVVPQIMYRQAKVSPLLVIISLYIGGTLGGILGAFVAIPLSAALRVIAVRVIAPSIRQRTLHFTVPETDNEKSVERDG